MPAHAAFRRLCVMGFLAYCSYAMCRTPLLPLLARDLGATAAMIGMVMGASTLTGVLVKLPAGAWSDVCGRRPLLVVGTIVFATMPFTYLGVASVGTLVALRFLHGAATAIVGPVASAGLSDLAPIARRATWLSTYSTVQGVGQALGPVIAGYLIASGRYDVAFTIAGALALATPFVAATWPAQSHEEARSAFPHRTAQFRSGISGVIHHPLILATSLAQAALFVLNGSLNAFLPLFAREAIGFTASQLGWLFALQTATTLATRPLMGRLSDRIGRRFLIVTGMILSSAGVLLVSLATASLPLVTAVLLYASGVAITTAATSAFITDLSARTQYGTAHGVFGTIYDVGDALGPILAGVLVMTVGYAHMFQVMSAIALIGAAGFSVVSVTTRVAVARTPSHPPKP